MLGEIISGTLGYLGQRDANRTSARSVQRQIEFQKEAYQNRYTWQREDMIRAGLNPMLAYQQGAGPALSGANYQAQSELGAGVNSALASRRLEADLDVLEEQAKNVFWDTQKKQADTSKTDIEAANARKFGKILDEQLTTAKAKAYADKITEEFLNDHPWVRKLDIFGKALNPFAAPVNSAKGVVK